MRRQLDEYKEDWVKVKNTEKNYQAEGDEAAGELERLRGEYDPAAECVPLPASPPGKALHACLAWPASAAAAAQV